MPTQEKKPVKLVGDYFKGVNVTPGKWVNPADVATFVQGMFSKPAREEIMARGQLPTREATAKVESDELRNIAQEYINQITGAQAGEIQGMAARGLPVSEPGVAEAGRSQRMELGKLGIRERLLDPYTIAMIRSQRGSAELRSMLKAILSGVLSDAEIEELVGGAGGANPDAAAALDIENARGRTPQYQPPQLPPLNMNLFPREGGEAPTIPGLESTGTPPPSMGELAPFQQPQPGIYVKPPSLPEGAQPPANQMPETSKLSVVLEILGNLLRNSGVAQPWTKFGMNPQTGKK